MARFLIIVTLVTATLGAYRPAAAQTNPSSSWQVQNPRIPLVSLESVACPSPTVCQAGGQDTIFSTQDGGKTWHHLQVHKGSRINQVACVSPVSCFALDQGITGQIVVVQTRDGGHTWADASVPSKRYLSHASCPTPSVCYAIGGPVPAGPFTPLHMFRSADAGAHWTQVKGQSLYTVMSQSLTCPGPALCYLGGNGSLVVTTNGGRTWTIRVFPTGHTAPVTPGSDWSVNSISCVAAEQCYLITQGGRVMGTQDGWVTSRQLRPGDPQGSASFNEITCPAPADCYLSGFSPRVLATTNGGASWTMLATGSSNSVRAIACSAPATCTAVGDSTTILTTRDAGASWQSGFARTTNSLSAVSCVDASTCTAVGAAGTVVGTGDGGKTWRVEPSGIHQSLDAASCPTATVCYAVGGSRYALPNGEPNPAQLVAPVILRTSNGGSSWAVAAQQPIAGRPLALAGITCPTAQICYATSDSGAILSTVDGGSSWRWQQTGAHFQLRGIACPTTTQCLAVGGLDAECPDSCFTPEEGAIVVTQDGGQTWQRRFYRRATANSPSDTGAHLYSISCPGPTTCFAAGRNILVTSTDGGQTWRVVANHASVQGTPYFGWGATLSCPSPMTCWSTYGGPTPSRTEDGGRTWTPGPANPKPQLGPPLGLACPTADTCYAVGFAGSILRLMTAAPVRTPLVRGIGALAPAGPSDAAPALQARDRPAGAAVTSAPDRASQAANRPSLAQGWSMVTMPARKEPDYTGPAYSAHNGAPGWLLSTQWGLVTMSAELRGGPPVPPNEWVSRDGHAWQQIVLPSSVFGQDTIQGVASGRPGLAAVGVRYASGPSFPGPPAAWFSADGRTWRRAASVGNALALGEMVAVTNYGTGFVAVGEIVSPGDELSPFSDRMAVWTSPGGGRWQLVSGNSPVFQNARASVILHGGDGLVALGEPRNVSMPNAPNVIVWTSRDGRNWRRVPQAPDVFPTGFTVGLQGAVEGRGRYVAWGMTYASVPRYTIWTSTDGVRWRQAPGIHFQYGVVTAIAAHGSGFVALGLRDHEPTLWTSPDGARWAPAAGQNVFGPGDTQLGSAADWKGTLVVVGSLNRPVPFDPAPSASYAGPQMIYQPAAWLWRPGARSQSHPQWARTDPKWFRLRLEDLPPGFSPSISPSPYGGYPYGINCAQPPSPSAVSPCLKALATLGPSLAFLFQFPYGGAAPGQPAPSGVDGYAVLTGSAARARAAFGQAAGLASTIDLNEAVQPRLVRSLAIGRGAQLFSLKIPSHCPPGAPPGGPPCPPALQGGTAYAAVWWDGPALGVVGVMGVPGNREALAIRLAQRQWARHHALGF